MLTFLGDVALIADYVNSEYKPKNQYIFNCEYAICDGQKLKPVPGKINLSGKECEFDKIFGTNPVAVSLTNNHIFDFGREGYDETVKKLNARNIQCIDGRLFNIGNIYFISFMDIPSANALDEDFLFDEEKIKKQIATVKKNSNAKVIALAHWGIENDSKPNEKQIKRAHWLIDNGIDLIIGHHPHCVQSVEMYNGKYIFYSLGNGLFPPINQPSHFDASGQATRIYRFKWLWWNRKSLAVTIDDNANVVNVERLYQKKNTLSKINDISPAKLVNKKIGGAGGIFFYIRKYLLFFASNAFVDGKIFDFNAIKSERNKG